MMRHTRLALVLVLAVLPVCRVAGQVVTGPTREPLVARLVPCLGDERLQRELKLSPGQVKSLLAFRQKLWDKEFTTPRDKFDDGAVDRASATAIAFQEILSAEQLARARQVAVQNISAYQYNRLQIRIDTSFLARYPELAAPLFFDRDQSAVIGKGPFVYLTPPQVATLRSLQGRKVDAFWIAEQDSRPQGRYPSALSPPFYVLSAKDVRAELKLTEDQVRAINTLGSRSRERPDDLKAYRSTSPEASAKKSDAVGEKLEKILRPEQMTRIRQIVAQWSPEFSTAPDRFSDPGVQQELDLNAEQRQAIDTARAAYADAAGRAALSGGEPVKVAQDISAAAVKRDQDYVAGFTEEQKRKLATKFGEPFNSKMSTEDVVRSALEDRRAVLFGRYEKELSFLASNKSIQDELKLTPDRIKLIQDANARQPRVFYTPTEDQAEAATEYTEKTLATVLTPDQAKRFRLIQGGHPIDVLTPQQQVAIRGMLGEPFRGEVSPTFISLQPPTGPRGDVLMTLPADAADLQPAQAITVVRAINKHLVAIPQPLAGGLKGPDEPAQPDPVEVLEKAVTAAVSPEQVRRLDQLAVQLAAARNLLATLLGPGAGPRLKLATGQQERIIAIEQEWRKVFRLVLAAQLSIPERGSIHPRLRDRFDERILAVLTPEQRATWRDLTGEPYPDIRKAIPVPVIY
ncbi:MAG TPA: hypothetical protein VH092_14615 [Urbifossiella sp.]|jgi:hypothetical protein|nr:hypothetical protein [Urbifossiella sp.]